MKEKINLERIMGEEDAVDQEGAQERIIKGHLRMDYRRVQVLF